MEQNLACQTPLQILCVASGNVGCWGQTFVSTVATGGLQVSTYRVDSLVKAEPINAATSSQFGGAAAPFR